MFAQRLMCSWIGALGLATGAFGQTYVSFTNVADTFAYSINDSGVVAGSTSPNDSLGPFYGLVRAADGTITNFNAPGNALLSIFAYSINGAGAIAGYYVGLPFTFPNFTNHGYVRDPEGNITTFDPPGSVNTQAFSINARGAITGYYNESNLVIHGFLREPNGRFTSFNAPDSISTKAVSINAVGAITGYYQRADGSVHGFLCHPTGHITSFDPPGSTGTFPVGINYSGAITGYYTKADGRQHGFVRDAAGKITLFDGVPTSINDHGAIVGFGFLRSPDGTITSLFDAPFPFSCGHATSINNAGVIAGYCASSEPDIAWLRFP
jgi:hypothetical protein